MDLGIGEDEGTTALLDNSAAKHKMAVRPQRKRRSESRQRDGNQGDEAGMESSQQSDAQVEGNVKKIKSSVDEEDSAESKRGYRRTRSGRQLAAVDPVAKREYVTIDSRPFGSRANLLGWVVQGRRQGVGGNGGGIRDRHGTRRQRLLPPDGSSVHSEESQRPARCPFRSIQTNSRIPQEVSSPLMSFYSLP